MAPVIEVAAVIVALAVVAFAIIPLAVMHMVMAAVMLVVRDGAADYRTGDDAAGDRGRDPALLARFGG